MRIHENGVLALV